MEQIYRIKYLHDYEGKSLRKIADETGHHFATVTKYTATQDFNLELKPPQQRVAKLDPLKPLIVSDRGVRKYVAKRIQQGQMS